MNALKTISKTIDTIIDRIGQVLAYGVLIILVVITFEVVSRRIFNSPTIWAFEVIVMVFAAYVVLVSAYGLQKGSFVCVDVFSAKLSPVASRIAMLITYIIFFLPFVIGILPASFQFFWKSFSTDEHSWSQWAPVVWPVKLALFLGLLMLLAQGISEMIKSVVWLIEYKNSTNENIEEE